MEATKDHLFLHARIMHACDGCLGHGSCQFIVHDLDSATAGVYSHIADLFTAVYLNRPLRRPPRSSRRLRTPSVRAGVHDDDLSYAQAKCYF
jgi:hypothetical protein